MKLIILVILGTLMLAINSNACMPKAGAILSKLIVNGQEFAIARQISYSTGKDRELLNTFWAFSKRPEIKRVLLGVAGSEQRQFMLLTANPQLTGADGKKIDLKDYQSAWSIQTDSKPFEGKILEIRLHPKASELAPFVLKKHSAAPSRGIQAKGGCGPHF